MVTFVDPMAKDEKDKVFRLVTNGTLTPTLVDELRDAAKEPNHKKAAETIMRPKRRPRVR